MGRIGLFLAAVGLCLILSTCGIDSSAYLEPPTSASVSASLDQYNFHHNSTLDVDPVFLGYEILYRLYEDKVDADADKAAIETESANAATIVYARMLSQSYKYCRITVSGQFAQEPLIPRNTDGLNDDNVTLNFTNKLIEEPRLTIGGTEIHIRRGVRESLSDETGKSFLDISRADVDVKPKSPTSSSPVDGMVYFQAYAFSSGIDNDLAMIYSTPILIGNDSKLYLKNE